MECSSVLETIHRPGRAHWKAVTVPGCPGQRPESSSTSAGKVGRPRFDSVAIGLYPNCALYSVKALGVGNATSLKDSRHADHARLAPNRTLWIQIFLFYFLNSVIEAT